MSEQFAGLQANYVSVTWPGRNTSGYAPFGDYVLICVDACAEKTASGLIEYPPDLRDRYTLLSETGCIYYAGEDAFRTYSDGSPWTGAKPAAGDRVYFAKYAGTVCRGRDGHIYRVMGFREVILGIDPEYAPADDAPEATET